MDDRFELAEGCILGIDWMTDLNFSSLSQSAQKRSLILRKIKMIILSNIDSDVPFHVGLSIGLADLVNGQH